MTEATDTSDHVDELVERMIGELRELNAVRTETVEKAVRAVPRHLFLPEEAVEDAYAAERSLVTKRDEQGNAISSVSAARIQAFMLEQAEIRPGMRVLEVGSGGLNAAYLAELVGEKGEVISVDIDPEVTARAERLLEKAGYADRVRVVLADAEIGVPEYAPFDRIVITVGAWDIPLAWISQLTEGGRLVVPLRMRGLTRSVAFQRVHEHLEALDYEFCGFVPMQGASAHQADIIPLTGDGKIAVKFDDTPPSDPGLLNGVMDTERAEVWTGVVLRYQEVFESLQLYLATVLDGYCGMVVDPDLESRLVAPDHRRTFMTAVDGGNLAYLVFRRLGEDRSAEFGVHAFGSEGAAFAEAVAEHVRAWGENKDRHGGPGPHVARRDVPGPHIAVYPANTPDDELPELPHRRVIDKRHSRVILSWFPPVTGAGDQGVVHDPTE